PVVTPGAPRPPRASFAATVLLRRVRVTTQPPGPPEHPLRKIAPPTAGRAGPLTGLPARARLPLSVERSIATRQALPCRPPPWPWPLSRPTASLSRIVDSTIVTSPAQPMP